MQRGREGSCFPGSCTQSAFCAGKYPQAPCKHCPSEGGTTAPACPQMETFPALSRGPQQAVSPAPGTHSPWARVGNAHSWALGSSTQPSPRGVQEGAAGCRQNGGSHLPGTSSHALGTQAKCCCSSPRHRASNAGFPPPQEGFMVSLNRHPQQPTLDRVSLVNKLYFIQGKAN